MTDNTLNNIGGFSTTKFPHAGNLKQPSEGSLKDTVDIGGEQDLLDFKLSMLRDLARSKMPQIDDNKGTPQEKFEKAQADLQGIIEKSSSPIERKLADAAKVMGESYYDPNENTRFEAGYIIQREALELMKDGGLSECKSYGEIQRKYLDRFDNVALLEKNGYNIKDAVLICIDNIESIRKKSS